jgi:hypothetical protein
VVEYLQMALGETRFNKDDAHATQKGFCLLVLMFSEDGKYLSLALPVNPNW